MAVPASGPRAQPGPSRLALRARQDCAPASWTRAADADTRTSKHGGGVY